MITLEKIQERLKAEREKMTLGKQVSDKWIVKRSERLLKSVTEEMDDAEIDNLVADSVEDMNDMQANINSVMKEEAAKNAKTSTKSKTNEKTATETQTAQVELPDEVKEMLAYYKTQKQIKEVQAKRDAICNAVKGLNDSQKTSFREYINDINLDLEADTDELATQCMAKFSKIFSGSVADDTGIKGAGGTKADENPNAKLYESMGKELIKQVI